MKFPEKVTEYGGPHALFRKIEETYEVHGDIVVIHRRIWLKTRMDFVVLKVQIPDDLVPEART